MKTQMRLSANARRPVAKLPRVDALDAHVTQIVALLLRETSQSSLTLKCLSAVESGRWSDYSDLSINPSDYVSAANFATDYLAVEVLSKYPFENRDSNRVQIALDKFADSETLCTSSNMRLWRSSHFPVCPEMWPAVQHTARRKIERVLGPFIREEAEAMSGFGPGATTSLRRLRGDAYHKFGHLKPDTTPDNAYTAWEYVRNIPRWFETLTGALPTTVEADFLAFPPSQVFNIVRGNRVTTVPKNFKTDRVIGIEPDLNMYVQKGIGSCIRKRLRRIGVDLDDQTLNQRLAREGSMNGNLATLDLSSASDTICIGIVESLIPDDWLTALKQCRSPYGVLPSGESVLYRKFSSMGNGYTFELESLIFWALSSAVCDLQKVYGVVTVYGDDIIVPVEAYPTVVQILEFAGFLVNKKKSFASGPFRESCGKHYFEGEDVTPFYIRERPVKWPDIVAICNKLRRHARLSWGLDPSYLKAYMYTLGLLPPMFRNHIPDDLGDLGLVVDFDEASPRFCTRAQTYSCKILLCKTRPTGWGGIPYLLRQLHSKEKAGAEVLQEPTHLISTSFKLKSKTVKQWPSFGPWLV